MSSFVFSSVFPPGEKFSILLAIKEKQKHHEAPTKTVFMSPYMQLMGMWQGPAYRVALLLDR